MPVPTVAGAPGAPARQCPNSWRPGWTSSGSDDVRGVPAAGRMPWRTPDGGRPRGTARAAPAGGATSGVQFAREGDPIAAVTVQVQGCPQYAESNAKEFPCGG